MEQKIMDQWLLRYATSRTHFGYFAMSKAGEINSHIDKERARSYAERCYRHAVEALNEISDETPEVKEHARFLEGIIRGIAGESLQIRL